MFFKKNKYVYTLVITAMLHFNVVWAETDLKDSKDHLMIPRISGTTIAGFSQSSYDEGEFMTGAQEKKLISETIEGKRTRIMYIGPKDLSPLGALRSYQKSFADLGEVEQVYTCKKNNCFRNLGESFIWSNSNRIPNNLETDLPSVYVLYGGLTTYKDQIYWYGKIKTSESLFHVSIYSAIMSKAYDIERVENHPLIHLEIIESVDGI